MTIYKFAQNNNNVAGLATISIQPHGEGPLLPEERYPVSGAVAETGQTFFVFRYNVLTPDEFTALNAEFGLSQSVKYKDCTFQAAEWDYDTAYTANGRIIRPARTAIDHRLGLYTGVEYRIIKVVKLAEFS